MPQPNYFADPEVAARYERVRPFYHPQVVAEIARFAESKRFGHALDVGCGTGKSSLALAEIAEHVTAIDPAPEMLSQAKRVANVTYQCGSAEHLEFADRSFDLISVGAALHWFDADRFYSECRRVLAPDGLLAVYNDHFTAHMKANDDFKRWVRTRFLRRYRRPLRRMTDFEEDVAQRHGFRVAHRHSFEHLVSYTREEFAAYLLTHTNTLSVIDLGRETTQQALDWLHSELAPFMDGVPREFIFKCNVWVLKKHEVVLESL